MILVCIEKSLDFDPASLWIEMCSFVSQELRVRAFRVKSTEAVNFLGMQIVIIAIIKELKDDWIFSISNDNSTDHTLHKHKISLQLNSLSIPDIPTNLTNLCNGKCIGD